MRKGMPNAHHSKIITSASHPIILLVFPIDTSGPMEVRSSRAHCFHNIRIRDSPRFIFSNIFQLFLLFTLRLPTIFIQLSIWLMERIVLLVYFAHQTRSHHALRVYLQRLTETIYSFRWQLESLRQRQTNGRKIANSLNPFGWSLRYRKFRRNMYEQMIFCFMKCKCTVENRLFEFVKINQIFQHQNRGKKLIRSSHSTETFYNSAHTHTANKNYTLSRNTTHDTLLSMYNKHLPSQADDMNRRSASTIHRRVIVSSNTNI